MIVMSEPSSLRGAVDLGSDAELLAALRTEGAANRAAVARLRELLVRAAARQVRRMPSVWVELGDARAREIIEAAADEATVDVLGHLDRFEGRSRFSTWVYKFGIWHAAAEVRRATWRDRPVDVSDMPEQQDRDPATPDTYADASDLADAVAIALEQVLTPHQRRIAKALIIEEVPIDVLAQRLGTNRNAIYKTLHDVRVKLRRELTSNGFLDSTGRM